jgi:hypothetical protein
MSAWPKNREACANCTCTAGTFSYRARGYCSRCYNVIRQIRDIEAWDRKYPETLKHVPKDGIINSASETHATTSRLITDTFTDEKFETCREGCIKQLRQRLVVLRHREEIRRCEIEVKPLDLEHKFAELLKLIRPKAEYPRNASYINQNFNEKERRVIYALLEGVIEQAPWPGISIATAAWPTNHHAENPRLIQATTQPNA